MSNLVFLRLNTFYMVGSCSETVQQKRRTRRDVVVLQNKGLVERG